MGIAPHKGMRPFILSFSSRAFTIAILASLLASPVSGLRDAWADAAPKACSERMEAEFNALAQGSLKDDQDIRKLSAELAQARAESSRRTWTGVLAGGALAGNRLRTGVDTIERKKRRAETLSMLLAVFREAARVTDGKPGEPDAQIRQRLPHGMNLPLARALRAGDQDGSLCSGQPNHKLLVAALAGDPAASTVTKKEVAPPARAIVVTPLPLIVEAPRPL